MKKTHLILLIIFLFAAIDILAQKNNDLIKLDNIVVFGKTHGFSDSLRIVNEDNQYTGMTDLDRFNYIPFHSKLTITRAEKKTQSDQALLQFIAGNKSLINSHLIYCSPFSGLLNFSADYNQNIYQSNWKYEDLSIYWQPVIKGYKSIVSYYYSKYHADKAYTSLTGSKAVLPKYDLDLSSYGSVNLSGDLSYTELKQDDLNSTLKKQSINASLETQWQNNDLENKLSLNYLADSFQLETYFIKKHWLIDLSGIWIALDTDHIDASIKYDHNLSLGNDFSLLLSNHPYLRRSDHKYLLENNHYLDISPEIKQENVPLNHTISLQLKRDYEIILSWNSQYIINRTNYTMIDHPDEWLDLYYEPEYLDTWKNEISAQFSWKFYDVCLKHHASYVAYEKDINFVPVFTFNNYLTYIYQNLTTSLDIIYNTGRHDNNDNIMKDLLLLDIGFKYRLLNNLNITAKIENIANCENREYNLSPKKTTVVLGGFEFKF